VQENGGKALDIAAIQDLITAYVHKFDEEYDTLKKSRRSGRPPGAREDLLKMKISALETEYQQGFSKLLRSCKVFVAVLTTLDSFARCHHRGERHFHHALGGLLEFSVYSPVDQSLQGWPKPSCRFPIKGTQLIHHPLMAFIRCPTVTPGIFQHDYA
jgi:hypothetical protein